MVDSKSWETEVTGKPGFNSGFSAVTVFRLGTDSETDSETETDSDF